MPKKTTFQVALWRETHYALEIEASSYKEAELKAYHAAWSGDIDEYEEGEQVFISDSQCLDPYWDEYSEEEETESMEVANGI